MDKAPTIEDLAWKRSADHSPHEHRLCQRDKTTILRFYISVLKYEAVKHLIDYVCTFDNMR